ncbi:MAG: hypothetical protein V4594_09470 [Bacteroidota bacterium]
MARMHSSLFDWNAVLNADGDIIVIMRNGKPLKEQYEAFVGMIGFVLAEVPAMGEGARIVVTNEDRTEEYVYVLVIHLEERQ